MALTKLHIKQSFKAPVGTIFDVLSDHAQFGDIISANIKRVADSDTDNINGLGSIRSISIFPTPAFEETITAFEENKLIEYRITKGSPLKNHKGTMRFTQAGDVTKLDYQIEFETKAPIPFLGNVIKFGLEKALDKGLSQLANSFN